MVLPSVDLAGRFDRLGGDQVEDLQCSLLVMRASAIPDHLAEPGVQRLEGIARVHDLA
jgi:hypothetical protein